MQNKVLLITLIAGMLLLGFSTADVSQGKSLQVLPMGPTTIYYTGNVTIEPNGTLHGSAPGTVPITQSGNSFALYGGIKGTLTVLYSGADLNGGNYSLDPVYHSPLGAITVENASHVKVSNFNVTSGNLTFGVLLNNTSYDMINNVDVNDTFVGFEIHNHSHDINISNSKAHFNYINLLAGSLSSGQVPQNSLTISNITVYNFTANYGLGGIVMGAAYSKVLDSKVLDSQVELTSFANNTLFSGNSLNVNNSAEGIISSPTTGSQHFHNVSFTNNMIYANRMYQTPTDLITFQNTTGIVSGNEINVNASGTVSSGIYLANSFASVTNNRVNLTNVGSYIFGTSSGIEFSGDNYTISGNTVNLSGGNSSGIALSHANSSIAYQARNVTISDNNVNMNVKGGYGILLNATGSRVTGNVVVLNTTLAPITGIAVNGFNNSVDGNTVALKFYKVNPGLATGIGNIMGLPGNFGNLSISGNAVTFEFPHVSLFNSSYFVGINYRGNSASGLSIIGNTVTGPVLSGLAGTPSVIGSVKTGLQVSHNIIYGTGGILATGNNTTISFNNISYINPGIGFGGYHFSVNNAHIFDNTLNCLLDGVFGIDGELQGNLSITGNYFYGRVIDVAFFGGVSNATVYHNDFFNASAIPIEIDDSIGVANTNIWLNASYPIGGNYYAAYAGTDLYSGPLQNIRGADGIFDSPYSTSYSPGYIDKYPLAKPWLRPQFTIHETGLLSGAAWSATFNGQTRTSDGPSISFNLVNATYENYSYSYAGVHGYVGSGSGTYRYTGANNTSYTAAYTPIYQVNFTESGLPAGSTWQFSLNGSLHNVSARYFDIAVDNGTSVTYSARNSSSYYAASGNGQFTVTGNTTVDFTFYHYAYLVGDLLPSASKIAVNGKNITVSNGHFNISLAGGTYEVVVTDSGYSSSYRNITLQPGQTYSLNVSLNRTASSGLTSSQYEYIGMGAAAAVALGIVAFMFRRKK